MQRKVCLLRQHLYTIHTLKHRIVWKLNQVKQILFVPIKNLKINVYFGLFGQL